MLRCPVCNHDESFVLRSDREYDDEIRRRRECGRDTCRARFTSVEFVSATPDIGYAGRNRGGGHNRKPQGKLDRARAALAEKARTRKVRPDVPCEMYALPRPQDAHEETLGVFAPPALSASLVPFARVDAG
jgi:hypothetical protein